MSFATTRSENIAIAGNGLPAGQRCSKHSLSGGAYPSPNHQSGKTVSDFGDDESRARYPSAQA